MTVYGAIFAAVSRKISAFVAECRELVAEAKAEEQKLLANLKIEIDDLKALIVARTKRAEQGQENLRNDLVEKISKL